MRRRTEMVVPFLPTPSLLLPSFLAHPRRALSLARFSFACSISSPPEKGKESAATQANETFISMIHEPLFFPFVNRARDPSLYDPHLNMGLLSSTIVVNIVRQSYRRFALATQTQAIRMNQVKMEFDANTSFGRCHGLLAVFRRRVIWIQYFH